tara:strand:+ start:107 stop:364 length:258 start_codon:yes stop_codon:yes gene_type:complete
MQKMKRLEKMVIDFLRVNDVATTSQIFDYVKSQITARRNADYTKQELGNNLIKWCVKVDMTDEWHRTSQHKRKVLLWKLRDEYEV